MSKQWQKKTVQAKNVHQKVVFQIPCSGGVVVALILNTIFSFLFHIFFSFLFHYFFFHFYFISN